MVTEVISSKFADMLEARGVSRRSFMKLCGTLAVAAGLSELAAPRVAKAIEGSVIGATSGDLYPVIWIEGASCTGCTESFAQVDNPDPATVVLDMISLNYCETLSAAAGYSMEEAKAQTIAAGNYILIYEGAVLERWDGEALRVANEPGTYHLAEAAEHANAVLAVGSCAVNGGWMGAHPNSAGALGVQQYLQKAGIETPVINIPGCPVNPEWIEAVLVDAILVGQLPELNGYSMPSLIFNQTVHVNCERRGHFENGEFVYAFGTEEEAKNYCLYPMGCRGPQTKANCGVVRWNKRRSWCVASGGPCIGCCTADPMDPGHNWVETNTPFRARFRDLRIGGAMIQPEAIAWTVTGVLAAALVIHGFGMKKTGRTDGGAPFEKMREWDAKHPNESIGRYSEEVSDNVKGGN